MPTAWSRLFLAFLTYTSTACVEVPVGDWDGEPPSDGGVAVELPELYGVLGSGSVGSTCSAPLKLYQVSPAGSCAGQCQYVPQGSCTTAVQWFVDEAACQARQQPTYEQELLDATCHSIPTPQQLRPYRVLKPFATCNGEWSGAGLSVRADREASACLDVDYLDLGADCLFAKAGACPRTHPRRDVWVTDWLDERRCDCEATPYCYGFVDLSGDTMCSSTTTAILDGACRKVVVFPYKSLRLRPGALECRSGTATVAGELLLGDRVVSCCR